jgi:hypothetical protein
MLWVLSLTGLGLQQAQAIEVTNQLVSVGLPGDTGDAASTATALSSADGRYSLFSSWASNLVEGVSDYNSSADVFLYDRITDSVTLISHAAESTALTASSSSTPTAISANGEWVLFESYASDVVSGVIDNNDNSDVFLYRRSTGEVTLISRSISDLNTSANRDSYAAAISADGEWVLFSSQASDLVAGVTDDNGLSDVFIFQRSTGAVTLVSHSADGSTITSNFSSYPTTISADGQWVLFHSGATNLVAGMTDNNGAEDAFLFQRNSGTIYLISHSAINVTTTANSYSVATAMSTDGEWVLFQSSATNLVWGMHDFNENMDVFLYRRSTGVVRLISHSYSSAINTGNYSSLATAMSADGEWIVFSSRATNLIEEVVDANGSASDIFLFQRSSGVVKLVTRSADSAITAANSGSDPVTISADGEWVLFSSNASNMVADGGDGNRRRDAFLYQRSTGMIHLISHSYGSANICANSESVPIAINANAGLVLFHSLASDIATGVSDSNDDLDVFIYQRSSGIATLVSRSGGNATITSNGDSTPAAMSSDGELVLFKSYASRVVPGVSDGNGNSDVFNLPTTHWFSWSYLALF